MFLSNIEATALHNYMQALTLKRLPHEKSEKPCRQPARVILMCCMLILMKGWGGKKSEFKVPWRSFSSYYLLSSSYPKVRQCSSLDVCVCLCVCAAGKTLETLKGPPD